MARQVERLTTQKVAATMAPGMYPDGDGLYLRVGPTGAKSWVFRYADGRTASGHQRNRDAGLGAVNTFSLVEARKRAKAMRQQRADGVDPIAARRQQRHHQAMTFAQCAEQFMQDKAASWSPKTQEQWRSSLRDYVFPALGAMPVANVTRPDVLRVLKPIWQTRTETAGRIRSRIENVLGWAVQHGHRPDGPNPATWRGALQHAGLPVKRDIAPTKHLAAMRYQDVPRLVELVRARKGQPARALEYTILTAARTGEVIEAQWSEIDLEARLWTIPAARMKSSREHCVPLSDAALAVLEGLERKGPSIFPGVSGNAMPYVLRTTPGGEGVTVHGMRSSFRDWCAETAVRRELAEAALAHSVESATEAAYNRSALVEQRRPVMQRWADYCDGKAIPAVVVPLRA